MKQIFAIGKEQIEISVPDGNVMDVLHANLPDIPLDEPKTILESLENPIGSPKLRDIVKPGEQIVIVTSDISRPMPSYKVLPAVLEEIIAVIRMKRRKNSAGRKSLRIIRFWIPTVKWFISGPLRTGHLWMSSNRLPKRTA